MAKKVPKGRHRPQRYDQAVVEALVTLWEASDRMCGKGLKDLIPVLLPVLVRNGRLRPDTTIHAKLLAVSAATIDRLLGDARAVQRQSPGGRRPTVLRRGVRKETLTGWAQPRPGYMEAQVISHRGERATGRAVQTLLLTDLYSGWTERAPVGVADRNAVIPHLHALVSRLPFKPRGLVLGGGFAFWKDALLRHFSSHHIEVISTPQDGDTRAPDQYRTDAVVPHLIGSRKLDGEAAVAALSQLYAASRSYINFFHGSRIELQTDALDTPYRRLLLSDALSDEEKHLLRSMAETLDPLQNLADMRGLLTDIRILAADFVPQPQDPRRGMSNSPGEAHGGKTAAPRLWRTHQNAFEAAWPTIEAWQAANPDQTGMDLFERLRREYPGAYREGQLRSLQRQLRQLRSRTDSRHDVARRRTRSSVPGG